MKACRIIRRRWSTPASLHEVTSEVKWTFSLRVSKRERPKRRSLSVVCCVVVTCSDTNKISQRREEEILTVLPCTTASQRVKNIATLLTLLYPPFPFLAHVWV